MSEAYKKHRQSVEDWGLKAGSIPVREVTFWDVRLGVKQKQSILSVCGYATISPLNPWSRLPLPVREAIKRRLSKQAYLNAEMLGLRLVPEELAGDLYRAELARIKECEELARSAG